MKIKLFVCFVSMLYVYTTLFLYSFYQFWRNKTYLFTLIGNQWNQYV